MPNPNQATAKAEPKDLSEHHEYVTKSRLEIRRILNSIIEQAAPVTVPVGGDDFFLTSIVGIDEDEDFLFFACTENNQHTEQMLDQENMLCSTSLEKIKIQFGCRPIEFTPYEGQQTLKTEVPRELMRLQRREYYRMMTPANPPVKCTLSTRRGATPVNLEFSLLDISCGGVAIITPPEIFAPALGTVYTCLIHLPGTNPLRAQVQARNAFMITLPDGKLTERSGFAFINLTENQVSAVQRFIMELERQRKVRSIGR